MNAVDENAIRDQLAHAVEILDPVAPPLSEIESRAAKRRRTFRLTGGIGAVALATACAVVAAVVITSGPGGTARVTPANAPSGQSLVDFATANGAIHSRFGQIISGPYESSAGFYGAFTVSHGVQVAKWDGTSWRLDGAPVSKVGAGRWVMKLGLGPQLTGLPTPSIYVRGMGGDVSYFGSILASTPTGWRTMKFGRCGHHKLCYPSDAEPYGHPGPAGFVSVNNSCTPDCAAGNEWRIVWRWDATKDKFVAARTHKM